MSRLPNIPTQILQTLQRMERNMGRGGTPSPSNTTRGVAGAVVAGNLASNFLSSAVGAAPTSGGTLAAQGGLLMQAIGSDTAVVNKVMALANALHHLRRGWDSASQGFRNYAVNSAIGLGAVGAAARYVPQIGHALFASGGLGFTGMSAGPRMGMLQGGMNLALGHGSEMMFGRNIVSSGFQVAGAVQMGIAANRVLSSRAFSRISGLPPGASRVVAGLGRGFVAGAIAAEVYHALPTGDAGEETRDQVEARGGNWGEYQALHRANTFNSVLNWGARNSALGGSRSNTGSENLERAARRAGVLNGAGGMWGGVTRMYDLMRPWTPEETNRVLEAHQNPTDEGLRTAQGRRGYNAATRRRDDMTLALGFQSRQMEIGDLHGQVQQEAVKTETQQQSMEYYASELNKAVQIIQNWRTNTPPS